jgi:predicted transcriptional regulator
LTNYYRTRIDIIANILDVVSLDAKKTQIMYKANLNYKALTKYLNEVISASLVVYNKNRQFYELTERGRDFLETYKKYCKANKRFKENLSHLTNTKRVLNDLCPVILEER